jgi:hypothetical protein
MREKKERLSVLIEFQSDVKLLYRHYCIHVISDTMPKIESAAILVMIFW